MRHPVGKYSVVNRLRIDPSGASNHQTRGIGAVRQHQHDFRGKRRITGGSDQRGHVRATAAD
jgi:hypothetical protein